MFNIFSFKIRFCTNSEKKLHILPLCGHLLSEGVHKQPLYTELLFLSNNCRKVQEGYLLMRGALLDLFCVYNGCIFINYGFSQPDMHMRNETGFVLLTTNCINSSVFPENFL